MNILVLYRHFWPDSPPYASMLRSILRRLAAQGHQVTVWAEEPCYKLSDGAVSVATRETLDGIRVERFARLPGWRVLAPVRLLDKLAFPLRQLARGLIRRLRGERFDLVWTATIPPVAQGLTGRWLAALFGARFLYHCQDLYPELGAHSGFWRDGGMLHRMLAAIERRSRQRADVLVTLSQDMAATVTALAQPQGRLVILNNFMLEDFTGQAEAPAATAPKPQRGDGRLQLIFAGNMGQFQGLEALVDAMRLVAADCPQVELVLMGDGKALPALRARAQGLSNVRFEPHRPFEDAQALIAAADVGVVSLEPGIHRFAFPSKTMTYLGLSLPLLVIVEPDSDLVRMVESEGLGWVASGRAPEPIAAAIRAVTGEATALPERSARAGQWFHANMDRPVILERWTGVIGGLAGEQA